MNVGIHYSNKQWEHPSAQDLQRLKLSKPECIKTCLFTQVGYDQVEMHKQLRREIPDAVIVVRLFAPMGGGPWPPEDFARQFFPHIEALRGVVEWFEVHNEPNHERHVEGFGTAQAEFEEFAHWAARVLQLLKHNHPWAKWVFPGQLSDGGPFINFWKANLDTIRKFDAWGVHCYWQFENHTVREWGRCYEIAHEMLPDKPIFITEFGDSTNDRSPVDKIRYYQEWFKEADRQPYILGTALYILGGTSDWINRPGIPNFDVVEEMARVIGDIPRQDRKAAPRRTSTPARTPKAATAPPPAPTELKPGMVTNQDIITTFANIAKQLGFGQWDLMSQAGLSLGALAANRQAPYSKGKIDDLPGLTEQQRSLIKAELVRRAGLRRAEDAVNFAIGAEDEFIPTTGPLLNRPELMGTPLEPARDLQINLKQAKTALEKRVARAWNRYGMTLLAVADALELEPAAVVAVVAELSARRGLGPDGRLLIRFEPQVFFEKWGRKHADVFSQHFKFDLAQPHQGHRWRSSKRGKWQDCHANQQSEWAALSQARLLDDTAAKLSVRMGLVEMMGFNYVMLGYQSVDEMFAAFATSERFQIFALFDFVGGESSDSRRLVALQEQDFDTFAALHYGFGDAARYSNSLSQAVEAFQRFNPIQ